MKLILQRMSEPSSWAGLAGLMGLAFGMTDGEWAQYALAIAGVASTLLAIGFREKGDQGG